MQNEELILKLSDKVSKNPADYPAVSDFFEMCRIYEPENHIISHQFNKDIRKITSQQVAQHNKDAEKFYLLHKKSLLFDSKDDFDAFLLYIDFNKLPMKRFYLPRRKALKPIADAFQEVYDGKLDLLTVSQPKRTGKTTIGLMFVMFLSGNHPEKSSICSGAGDDLVTSFYEGCLDIPKNEQYGFLDVFPTATLEHTNADKKIINLESRKRFATITCRSIDGALTGSTEATNLLYLDDLVSNDVEAKNRARLDILWDKTRGDLMGRRLEGCPIIAQGTRYSIYDPIGRLQEYAPSVGWRYKVLEIPALNENDESNFEMTNAEGLKIFTTDYYRKERILLSEEQWESQFQQSPFEAKGLMFPDSELKRYFHLPVDRDPDAVIAFCDTAESGNDSTCLVVGKIYGEEVFIDDVVFDNSGPEITKPQCAKVLIDNKVQTAEFESNNAGEYYAKDVNEIVENQGGKVSIRKKRSISNKVTRIGFASDGIKKYFYFKDKSLYTPQSQYGQYMKELTGFTRTGKVKHDDAPDGTAGLENMIRTLSGNKVEVINRPC